MMLSSSTSLGVAARSSGGARAHSRVPGAALRVRPHHRIGSVAPSDVRDVRARSKIAEDPDIPAGSRWYDKACGPNSMEVSSIQELVDVLATDQLVIVDFFAPWCGACRALFPKLHKLLQEYPDVVLVKVNFEANRAMCKSLGIKVLPFFHFYHGAQGRVAAFSATVSKLQRLKDALELHSGAICSLEEPAALDEFPDVHAEHPGDATLLGRDGWGADGGRVAEPAAAS
ncbi:MAG: thioredoxin-like protein [Monoraphidium minutum]|nr:MAG: thioredoxin-like protein [Monoraphidium minutum]